MNSNEDKDRSLKAETPQIPDTGPGKLPDKLPGKLPNQKLNHFHIAADPVRLKAEEIKQRQDKRLEEGRPSVITNEVIYDMLIDILENQKILEAKLLKKPAANSLQVGPRL
ncbi:hypothetical protein [Paenibacillus arenilitoris]|uniref:Uncharacterized protein n=1 Tax=Paenibacillus arenilitoris TaxID=2772299 RepID=A0A927CLA6_9BACL|nr:hypothetical protein [Paenibacillus arenilitoris]MBD2867730.1 hypothetical protein [Paenibacillus arenilitoris]